MSIQQSKFKAIADKIRGHLGATEPIKPNDFADKIDDVASFKFNLGNTIGYGHGYEEAEQIAKELEQQRNMGLGYALTSGDVTADTLDQNINQAVADISSIKTLIENNVF